MGVGLRVELDSHWDDSICPQGKWILVKIWARKKEIGPLSGLSTMLLHLIQAQQYCSILLTTMNNVKIICCVQTLAASLGNFSLYYLIINICNSVTNLTLSLTLTLTLTVTLTLTLLLLDVRVRIPTGAVLFAWGEK